ncbi:MAG TPA: LptA/OstA family protein [Trueperaceae bacterium]
MPRRVGALLFLLALAGGVALGQTPNVARIERNDTTIVITNEALAENGARTVGNLPCEGVRTSVFLGPPNDVEMVIDDETTIRSSIAIIERPQGDEGSEGQETIEMLDGTIVFAPRPPCPEEFIPAEDQTVVLEQGRTTISATRFFLDREVDVAQLEGPIGLRREPEGDAEQLSATADSMTYDLETDRSTLSGNVRVEAGDRVTEAEKLELDEAAGLATLTGTPARSVQGEDEIAGNTLLYYLDSNDVIVVGNVKGELEVDLD